MLANGKPDPLMQRYHEERKQWDERDTYGYQYTPLINDKWTNILFYIAIAMQAIGAIGAVAFGHTPKQTGMGAATQMQVMRMMNNNR